MANSVFIRRGSNTVPVEGEMEKNYQNTETVLGIENNSRNSIGYTLDGVIDFMNFRHKDMLYSSNKVSTILLSM
jgi:hypothetical protein